ncbi:MAG: tetratricopeptide repeat protein [Deltaproteobacteria bacterium]|nr:tetratricopeptide repeat protein [Deltaproteobacteria bacterium]
MTKKRAESGTDLPQPSPELVAAAKKANATIISHDPLRIEAFLRGDLTLGELEGISKESQYQMAQVGHSLLREGKRDQAKKIFEGLQALDPYDAYFHATLGAIAQEEGDVEKAERLYTRSLEINPFSIPALAGRGEIRLIAGRFQDAITDLAAALKEDPEAKQPATKRVRGLLAMVRTQLEASKANPAGEARDARKLLEAEVGALPPEAPAPAKKAAVKAPSKPPVRPSARRPEPRKKKK